MSMNNQGKQAIDTAADKAKLGVDKAKAGAISAADKMSSAAHTAATP